MDVEIPTIIAASGPVISTATKPEVMEATMFARGEIGDVWLFDPSGEYTELPAGPAPAVLVARRGGEHLGCGAPDLTCDDRMHPRRSRHDQRDPLDRARRGPARAAAAHREPD